MEGGLASGWYLSRAGTTYGPYDWELLATWARESRIDPRDPLWHARYPGGWTPAWRVPGLFPGWNAAASASAPACPQPARPGSRKRKWVLVSALVGVVVVAVVVGALAGAGVFSSDIPLVQTPMRGPTVIDVAYDSSQLVVAPDEGGQLEFQGARVSVPKGAVSAETTLELKVLQERFNVTSDSSQGDQAFVVGPMVDFGPEGAVFDRPVTVTVPYDEDLLPAGFDEKNILLAYWDGQAWASMQGYVDTDRNTVTVQLEEFTGIIETTVAGVLIVGGVMAATGAYLWSKLTESDPILEGTASRWIQTDDHYVQEMAWRANLGGIRLKDAGQLAAFLEQQTAAKVEKPISITFFEDTGLDVNLEGRYSKENRGWNKPSEYFTTLDMRGDCTDVTNATVSVFRSLGYPAKAVFGYTHGAAHAWGEVLINNRMYLIDEEGGVSELQAGMARNGLTRPGPGDSRNVMWDETGQKVQDPDWYKPFLTETSTAEPLSTTTSSTTTTVGGVPGTGLRGTWTGVEKVSGVVNRETPFDVVFDLYPLDGAAESGQAHIFSDEEVAGELRLVTYDPSKTPSIEVVVPTDDDYHHAATIYGDLSADGSTLMLTGTSEKGEVKVIWELRRR